MRQCLYANPENREHAEGKGNLTPINPARQDDPREKAFPSLRKEPEGVVCELPTVLPPQVLLLKVSPVGKKNCYASRQIEVHDNHFEQAD
jgi:hypothetical protein